MHLYELTAAYRGGPRANQRASGSGWWVSFTYSDEAVQVLKRRVPPTHRAWDPEQKEWWVSCEYEDVVLDMFPEFDAYLRQLPLF